MSTNSAQNERTLVITVPENQSTVQVRLEIETNCSCGNRAAGNYTDSEPPKGRVY